LISLTHLVIPSISRGTIGINISNPNILYISQTIYTVVAFGVSLLWLRHNETPDTKIKTRNQIRIIIYGAILALIIGVIGGLSKSSGGNLLSSLAVTVFATITFFAIFRHGLFDIQSFVMRAVGYSFTLVIIGAIYVIPGGLLLSHILHAPLHVNSIIFLSIFTLVVAVLFEPLRLRFNTITNRIFFRNYYNSQDILDRLSELLVGSVNIDNIKSGSTKILEDSMRPRFIRYLLIAENNSEDKIIINQLIKENFSVILFDEFEENSQDQVYNVLKNNQIAVAVRLRTTRDLGFMCFGYKESGVIYSQSDKQLLNVVANEIAVSLQNALRFREIESFNITLQQKIDAATKQLIVANSRLKELDNAKDDFIGMASHQLRTPLTLIRGYIKMVTIGDVGKVNDKQKKFLIQAQDNAERMVDLVTELLNVSRITSGKFSIEASPVDLATLINDEIKHLSNMAMSRKIDLTFHKPEHFPLLMLDEEKTKQVVINFIDNAIHYSRPKGGKIDVQLTAKNDIELRVVDNGIGVPEKEKENLFTKFYRAKNAKDVRPDGTGIGLYLAKVVVTEEGGDLIFESKEDVGSTFGFKFKKDKIVSANINDK
jgi:signal transduction histidine kinase